MLRLILQVAAVVLAVVGFFTNEVRWTSAAVGCLAASFLTES